MRTTLTLEPAVAERISRVMATRGQSMKEVVNQALREGLKVIESSSGKLVPKFVVKARDLSVRPGIDLDTIGRFADELEDETRIRRMNPGKA